MRPVDDDLVGLREARSRGEDRPGVAHGDVMAEEFPRPYERRGEVDSTEDDHAGRRHAGLDEQGEPAGAVRPVLREPDRAGASGVQQGTGLGGGRAVEAEVPAETALVGAVRTDQQSPAEQAGGAPDDPGEGRAPTPGGGGQRRPEHLPRRGVRADRRDQDVDGPATGQSDREGVLVAVAEAFADRLAAAQGVGAQLVHRALHTAAGDRADHRSVAVDGEGGAGPARRAAADGDDGGDGELPSFGEPAVQFVRDVKHPRRPRPGAPPPPARGRAGSAGGGGGPRSRGAPRWRRPPRRRRCRSRRHP